MSRQTMHAVRQRRKALGLVQMNVWIHEDDKEDFQKAVAPFRDLARQIEQDAREPRIRAAGLIEGVPFMVVYPVRKDCFRIISARKMHWKAWIKWQE